jgi:hypothetical protein
MVNCKQCKTPEECLRQGECEIKASERLDDFIQNNEFDFDEEKEEPSNCKYECD